MRAVKRFFLKKFKAMHPKIVHRRFINVPAAELNEAVLTCLLSYWTPEELDDRFILFMRTILGFTKFEDKAPTSEEAEQFMDC